MRRRVPKAVSLCMMAGLMAAGLQGIQAGGNRSRCANGTYGARQQQREHLRQMRLLKLI